MGAKDLEGQVKRNPGSPKTGLPSCLWVDGSVYSEPWGPWKTLVQTVQIAPSP